MSDISTHKQSLRYKLRALLKSIPAEQKADAGEIIARHIETWLLRFSGGHIVSIAFFKGLSDEINTEPLDNLLIRLCANRYVPYVTHDDQLNFTPLRREDTIKSSCAIDADDQTYIKDFDAIFVPGLGFDLLGHRLGRGKGYYDRALAHIKLVANTTPIFIGLAMDEQIVTEIPFEEHDVAMDYLCTPALGMWQI